MRNQKKILSDCDNAGRAELQFTKQNWLSHPNLNASSAGSIRAADLLQERASAPSRSIINYCSDFIQVSGNSPIDSLIQFSIHLNW
jgi:hypothetical protein